ncbi:MAG: hypothetical protein Q4B85_11445 [Lachnospiraceae bacterium]|nr:hypothetical protein [Lachnospiraceae bacterium]
MKKKRKWTGILFALLILFLYIMGAYDLPMMLTHNEAYYLSKGYGESAIRYFTDYPLYLLVFWVLNLAGGLISPILYLMKCRQAYKVAFLSAAADFILILLGVLFRERINALGVDIFCFDLFILVITFLFGVYLYQNEGMQSQ